MTRLRTMQILLLAIGTVFGLKAVFLFKVSQFEQLLYMVVTTIWAVWITVAVFKNWNLPAPFGFHEGKNQLARIAYCVLVNGVFLFVVLR
jgi:hypothetical protein